MEVYVEGSYKLTTSSRYGNTQTKVSSYHNERTVSTMYGNTQIEMPGDHTCPRCGYKEFLYVEVTAESRRDVQLKDGVWVVKEAHEYKMDRNVLPKMSGICCKGCGFFTNTMTVTRGERSQVITHLGHRLRTLECPICGSIDDFRSTEGPYYYTCKVEPANGGQRARWRSGEPISGLIMKECDEYVRILTCNACETTFEAEADDEDYITKLGCVIERGTPPSC